MSPEQIALVTGTIDRLGDRVDEAGSALYRRLFAAHPELQALFTHGRERQAAKFAAELEVVVALLPHLSGLQDEATALGARHAGYGVRAEHYPAVRDALLDTFADLLGAEFDDAHRLAWRRAYDLIAEVMLSGARTASVVPARENAEGAVRARTDEP